MYTLLYEQIQHISSRRPIFLPVELFAQIIIQTRPVRKNAPETVHPRPKTVGDELRAVFLRLYAKAAGLHH